MPERAFRGRSVCEQFQPARFLTNGRALFGRTGKIKEVTQPRETETNLPKNCAAGGFLTRA